MDNSTVDAAVARAMNAAYGIAQQYGSDYRSRTCALRRAVHVIGRRMGCPDDVIGYLFDQVSGMNTYLVYPRP